VARAAVELAKERRTDRMMRRLEALLVAADRKHTFILSGTGDVLEPQDGLAAVGSGGAFARAAALSLLRHSDLEAPVIAEEALRIAAEICIYTNNEIIVETI